MLVLWNTNNTKRNGVNKQNTQTQTKHSEKDNTEKDYLVKEEGGSKLIKVLL